MSAVAVHFLCLVEGLELTKANEVTRYKTVDLVSRPGIQVAAQAGTAGGVCQVGILTATRDSGLPYQSPIV